MATRRERFSLRMGKYEVRSCNENLLLGGEHNKIDLIEWFENGTEKESNYSIGYFKRIEGDWELRIIVSRLENVEWDIISELINHARFQINSGYTKTEEVKEQ